MSALKKWEKGRPILYILSGDMGPLSWVLQRGKSREVHPSSTGARIEIVMAASNESTHTRLKVSSMQGDFCRPSCFRRRGIRVKVLCKSRIPGELEASSKHLRNSLGRETACHQVRRMLPAMTRPYVRDDAAYLLEYHPIKAYLLNEGSAALIGE